jgi:hypothetical protein
MYSLYIMQKKKKIATGAKWGYLFCPKVQNKAKFY